MREGSTLEHYVLQEDGTFEWVDEVPEPYLEHYGREGMKWGENKFEEQPTGQNIRRGTIKGSLSPARYSVQQKSQQQAKANQDKVYDNVRASVKNQLGKMSDEDVTKWAKQIAKYTGRDESEVDKQSIEQQREDLEEAVTDLRFSGNAKGMPDAPNEQEETDEEAFDRVYGEAQEEVSKLSRKELIKWGNDISKSVGSDTDYNKIKDDDELREELASTIAELRDSGYENEIPAKPTKLTPERKEHMNRLIGSMSVNRQLANRAKNEQARRKTAQYVQRGAAQQQTKKKLAAKSGKVKAALKTR